MDHPVFLNEKKRDKLRYLAEAQAAESSTDERRYKHCGRFDHRDALSGRFPENYRNKRQRTSSSISTTSSVRQNLQKLNIESPTNIDEFLANELGLPAQ
ncbi:hypothetical protein G6F56_005598 [Rhizopus delemar]|nr:hypothetical protein G6F56_005598 [Rhizopus delemar]